MSSFFPFLQSISFSFHIHVDAVVQILNEMTSHILDIFIYLNYWGTLFSFCFPRFFSFFFFYFTMRVITRQGRYTSAAGHLKKMCLNNARAKLSHVCNGKIKMVFQSCFNLDLKMRTLDSHPPSPSPVPRFLQRPCLCSTPPHGKIWRKKNNNKKKIPKLKGGGGLES